MRNWLIKLKKLMSDESLKSYVQIIFIFSLNSSFYNNIPEK